MSQASVAHFKHQWTLDPQVTFLNHGSFGACPRVVLERQSEIRAELEREPVRFLHYRLESELDRVRQRLGQFLKADPRGIVFLPNATSGVASVIGSLKLRAGDELLLTDHTYGACQNVLERAAEDSGARVVRVHLPFPLSDEGQVLEAISSGLTQKTRLVLIDHVTSPTALILPVSRIVHEVQARGVDVLIDGAHAPGMLELDLDALGAAYYTANLHKWCCAPKGAALLYARKDRRDGLRPLVPSHGMKTWRWRQERSRLELEFDWPGTHDPSAILSVPAALDFLEGLLSGGMAALMTRNRNLAVEAGRLLSERLGLEPGGPESAMGSMAALRIPRARFKGSADEVHRLLFERHAIELFGMSLPELESEVIRLSAQAYNELADYERLASALDEIFRG